MVKKIISIFFILVFLIPLLPVKEVGQLIAGATMTEEIPDTGSPKSANGKADTKWLINADSGNFDLLGNGSQSLYIHFSETLPFLLASDVQTPPPNSFC